MKVKRIPMRTCVGCGQQKTKKELIRVVKNNEDQVFVDFKGKANGRGAYICPSLECLTKAQKRDALSRSLMIKIDREIYERLAQELAAGDQSEETITTEKDK
jgi:predicted RNA-binding protein YlxR (DUF448 family)